MMRIEGRLHANGEGGSGGVGGGGAGGSIQAHVHHMDGEGSLEVTGGRGDGSKQLTQGERSFKIKALQKYIFGFVIIFLPHSGTAK